MIRYYPYGIMRSLTVLLAEEEPIIALDIKYLLEANGVRVIQVTDQDAITEACRQFQPDLAILNFKQQDHGDTMALANVLKQRFNLPVMFVTSARPQDIAASRDFDPSLDILYKPFTRAQLLQCVIRHSGCNSFP